MKFDLDNSIDVLGRTPGTLRVLLGGIAEPLVRGTEGPETFSPFDVVGHLIDGEETDWMRRARIILSDIADRRFAPYDRFRHRARNLHREPASLLSEFAGHIAQIARVMAKQYRDEVGPWTPFMPVLTDRLVSGS
jgi:hypothetical protein